VSDVDPAAAPPELAGPFLVSTLHAMGVRMSGAAPRVLAAADDEAVHDLRVAIRRTRTVLEVGREVLGRFRADEVRRALREVQRATGDLRDEEVLLELIESTSVRRPDVRAWLDARRRREARLRTVLRRAVRAGDVDRGRQLLDALLAFRTKPSRERHLSKFARRAVGGALHDVERLQRPSLEDVDALHRLRIAYKRLRYTVEVFNDVLPEPERLLAPAASRFQSRLGDIHDADIGLACVERARILTDAGRRALRAALRRIRDERATAYAKEISAHDAARAMTTHASGTDSLRKTSTR
jgi:CHAD domain-containing protein